MERLYSKYLYNSGMIYDCKEIAAITSYDPLNKGSY